MYQKFGVKFLAYTPVFRVILVMMTMIDEDDGHILISLHVLLKLLS